MGNTLVPVSSGTFQGKPGGLQGISPLLRECIDSAGATDQTPNPYGAEVLLGVQLSALQMPPGGTVKPRWPCGTGGIRVRSTVRSPEDTIGYGTGGSFRES